MKEVIIPNQILRRSDALVFTLSTTLPTACSGGSRISQTFGLTLKERVPAYYFGQFFTITAKEWTKDPLGVQIVYKEMKNMCDIAIKLLADRFQITTNSHRLKSILNVHTE